MIWIFLITNIISNEKDGYKFCKAIAFWYELLTWTTIIERSLGFEFVAAMFSFSSNNNWLTIHIFWWHRQIDWELEEVIRKPIWQE